MLPEKTIEEVPTSAAMPREDLSGVNLRQREFSWSDPVELARQAGQLSGIEMFQRMIQGEIDGPPIAHTLGFRMKSAAKGRVVFSMRPQEFHYNPIGSMHGGVISTLLDSAMGCAVHSTLKAGTAYTSLEIKVNFIRPITTSTGPIECEGVQISGGRSTAIAEGRIRDGRGRILAYGSTTCMIFRGGAA